MDLETESGELRILKTQETAPELQVSVLATAIPGNYYTVDTETHEHLFKQISPCLHLSGVVGGSNNFIPDFIVCR